MTSNTPAIKPPKKIKEIAVIGAGISGIATAAHLLRHGQHVTVFERSGIAGGVWHFDPRSPLEPPYPNNQPPVPSMPDVDGVPLSLQRDFERTSLLHAPPSPCYAGLRNNVPTSLMRSKLLQWPKGTEEFVGQDSIEKYVQDLAMTTRAQDTVLYDTSVENVWKSLGASKWTVRTSTLRKTGALPEFLKRQWEFDAVVVASGHYHEPRVPDIPGLSLWKQRFPDSITHSKRYRSPGPFQGKTVLVVGGGVSSHDIAKELNGVAERVYVSTRGGDYDLPPPETAERVGGILRFLPHEANESSSIPGRIELQNGRILDNVTQVIVATGYLTSYPFLGDLQAPFMAAENADDKVVVTGDGLLTHNLHKDIWYIPDPSLSFVGVPFHVSTFSLFDFQGEAVARVLAEKATLPPEDELRREYVRRKESIVGSLRSFHSLFKKEVDYVEDVRAWLNRDAHTLGYEETMGYDEKWLSKCAEFVAAHEKRRASFGKPKVASEPLGGEGGPTAVAASA